MKPIIRVVLAATLACSVFLAFAQDAATTGTGKAKRKAPAKAAGPSVSDQLKTMQDSIQAQQQQIQQLMQQLQSRDGQIQQLQQQMSQVQSTATQAQEKADTAASQTTQAQADFTTVRSDVSDLKTSVTNTALTLQETQKSVQAAAESPLALHYKGITITPGGFLAAEFVRRSRALGSDINTPFNSLTMPGATQSTLSEFFGSGRQSRISMLAEGKVKNAKMTGYVEADFLSAGVTSNNNESNSYTLRQRQAWGQAAFDNGFTLTGGQMWSLVTETKHGMDNRSEALPMTIDPQYTVGFSWARQYGLRVTKGFNNKVWFGLSMENAQATISTHNNGTNFLIGSLGAGGGLYNAFNGNYSFNPSPDIVAKVAFEPGFGHYEIFGVYSRFRDRVFPCGELLSTATCDGQAVGVTSVLGAHNVSKNGGGIGANARWSFAKKRVDFGLHFLGGSGIGRYGTGGLADASVHTDGSLDLIRSYQGLGTLEWHTPKLDIYLNAGTEYASRAADFDPNNSKLYVGYGSPNFSNTGCYTETIPKDGTGFTPGSLGSCTADTRVLIEGTAGFWVKMYSGPKGRLQWGPQFSYVTRNTWSGASSPNEPHGVDGMIFTSFRYYLP